MTGYKNLIALVTKANLDGYYYKPRIHRELLGTTGLHRSFRLPLRPIWRGCWATGSRPGGGGPVLLRLAGLLVASTSTSNSRIMELPEQKKLNRHAGVRLKSGSRPVATNDVHYMRNEDASAHDVLLCIQTNSTVNEPKRMRIRATPRTICAARRRWESSFGSFPGRLRTRSASRSDAISISTSARCTLPQIEVPEGETPGAYLSRLCEEGARRRFGRDQLPMFGDVSNTSFRSFTRWGSTTTS